MFQEEKLVYRRVLIDRDCYDHFWTVDQKTTLSYWLNDWLKNCGYSNHKINIKWNKASVVESRRSKDHLIKWIPGLHCDSAVEGHGNCIKQIWGMEPIWLMDLDYDIVLEGSTTNRPSDATASQTSTNHYCRILVHTCSDPGERHGSVEKTSLWIMTTVTLVIYHHPERRWLG